MKFKYADEDIKINIHSRYAGAFQTIKDHADQVDNNDFTWIQKNILPSDTSTIIKLLLLADIPVFTSSIFFKSFYDIDILEFEVPAHIQIIEHKAFYLNYLEKVTFQSNCQLALIQRSALEDCEISEIELPDGLMHIESYVFRNCNNLNKVTLNKDICSIGQGCFYDCFRLKELYYKGTKEDFANIDLDDLWLEESSVKQIICTDGVIKV